MPAYIRFPLPDDITLAHTTFESMDRVDYLCMLCLQCSTRYIPAKTLRSAGTFATSLR